MAVQLESAARLAALRDKADAVTGESSATLAGAVDALIAGFGAGGGGTGGENLLDYARNIGGVFENAVFPSGTELVISFGSKRTGTINSGALNNTFLSAAGLKSVKVSCGLSGEFSMARFLNGEYGEAVLEKVDLSGMVQPMAVTNMDSALRQKTKLKEILGEFDMSGCTNVNLAFHGTESLETVRFTNGSINISINFAQSYSLSTDTIQSIVDGLADLTGGTAQTLTLHATAGGKLTDAQKAAIAAKNWTVTY